MSSAPINAKEAAFPGGVSLFTSAPTAELRREQISDLYDEIRPSLFSYLMGLGISADHAEDVIQESFLRLVRHLLAGRREDNLHGWLFRVAHNLSMDVHRYDQRIFLDRPAEGDHLTSDQISSDPTPEQTYFHNENLTRIQAAISQLTPQQRSCVLLRAQGLRYRDIAPVLGVSVQRVCTLTRKALVRLAEEL